MNYSSWDFSFMEKQFYDPHTTINNKELESFIFLRYWIKNVIKVRLKVVFPYITPIDPETPAKQGQNDVHL